MNVSQQIAKLLRDVYFGGNWTAVNYKDTLKDVTWQQAATKVYSFNTIITLMYHTSYYIDIVTAVLQGAPLNGKDEDSFKHPPLESKQDWNNLLEHIWTKAEDFATLVEQLPEEKLKEIFIKDKYGTYYRNLHGIIEHLHYHLGQIVLIKKIIQQQEEV